MAQLKESITKSTIHLIHRLVQPKAGRIPGHDQCLLRRRWPPRNLRAVEVGMSGVLSLMS